MEAPGRVRGMRRRREPRGQPHFVLPPNLYMGPPGRGDFSVSNFHSGLLPGNFAKTIFGVTALIGVIIAHSRFPDATLLLRSHYQFQIRTFWIGLLYVVVGAVLVTFVPVIGVAILIWWVIWSLVRNVKGLLALNDHKAI